MRNSLRVTRFAVALLTVLAGIDPAKGNGSGVNHYILGCDSACANFTGPIVTSNIDPTFTGSWYDPDQSGQGLFLEILPDHRAMAFWFTFNPAGTQQAWLGGTGTYAGSVATFDSMAVPSGGRWIPNFDPLQVVNNAWGTLKLSFADPSHGTVEFSSSLGYGAGSMNVTRLTTAAGISGTEASASGKAWVVTGGLNTPRSFHTATPLADGRVLVTGGVSGSNVVLDSAELYDPVTGNWTSAGRMTTPRSAHMATALPDGRVLVVGGDTAEVYDPATDHWTPTGSLKTPRVAFTATRLDNGRVLVAGGFSFSEGVLASAELYDPVAGTWSAAGNLRSAGYLQTAVALPDGRVLVTGGSDDGDLATVDAAAQIYDPLTNAWTATASLAQGRIYHTATTLADGNVLIVGGYHHEFGPHSLKDAQLYNPSTGKWTPVGDMSVAREGHSATRLSDGKILVAGGYDWSTRTIANNAELFDPATGTWSFGGSFDLSLAGHSATRLLNGNVLIAGGGGSAIAPISAEIYANVPVTASAGMTGAWYDPAQSGHGIIVEAVLGNRMLATWFAFNPAGTEQSWFLGVGSVNGNVATITAVDRPTGGRFIPNFDPTKIAHNPWGSLTFTFTDCDHGKVDFASIAGYGSGSMNLTRLTRPVGVVCQ